MITSASPRTTGALVCLALAACARGPAGAATEAELQSAIFRAKPAVVMVGVEVGATAAVRCGAGAATTVRPAPQDPGGAA